MKLRIMAIDRQKILLAARTGAPVEVKSHSLPPDTEKDLEEIMGIFLGELGQKDLFDHLSYCLRELTVNAKKANTKRVYFKEKGLNISDPKDYEKGMEKFKEDTLNHIDHYLALQAKDDLYIKVIFQIQDNNFLLDVRNNVPIAQRELSRVYDRIARSRAFNSMEEAFSEVLDETEGAGLGIVIMILMLKKMGLSERVFDLESTGSETIAALTIPISHVKLERINLLTDEIVRIIDQLPPFPENLQRVQAMLSDPAVDLEKISKTLGQDPALTADVVKFVNSAQFGIRRKIESISEAVRMIGIKGLKTILLPYGAHKILAKILIKQKSLWQDAVRVSLLAAEASKVLQYSREVQGEIQIGGLLYNLGSIILSIVHPDMSEKILGFCKEKGFTTEMFEDISSSLHQGEIGARIAAKWNFPEDLVEMIRYNNQPYLASKKAQPLVCVIHLATALLNVEKGLITYDLLNKSVLRALGINTEQRFEEVRLGVQKGLSAPL